MEALEVDPHRESVDSHQTIIQKDLSRIRLVSQDPKDAADEVLHVVVRVEADQIGSQQSLQDLLPPSAGKETKDLVVGKRDVKKESDAGGREAFPQQSRQEHQVIVVNPDQVIRPDNLLRASRRSG